MGIGGWLMYEGYKGASIASLKGRLKTQGATTAAGTATPATRVSAG